jgi:transposase
MARTQPWKVSDEFWEKVKPLLPPAPSHAKGGRPRMEDRQAFEAMVYVLRTGIQQRNLAFNFLEFILIERQESLFTDRKVFW